jgi:RNA recognition motif-containing protein
MAESTISVKPFPQTLKEEDLRNAFKDFHLVSIYINRTTSEAFIQFGSPDDV